MVQSKRAWAAVALGVLFMSSLLVAEPTAKLVEPDVPTLSDAHKRFLSSVARRTIRDFAGDGSTYQPDYVPAALVDESLEVIVRLRHQGYLLATGIGGPAPIAAAVRDAALRAVQMMLEGKLLGGDRLHSMLIEFEVIGAVQPISISADWTQPGVADAWIEPGVHGMVIQGARDAQRFCPTELLTSDLTLAEALTRVAQQTHADSSQIPNAALGRFRTLHWYAVPGSDEVVSLHRGLILVPPSAVNPRELDETIQRIAEYMAYRQLPSGLFTYQYEPATDRFSDDDNLVRQTGALAAMAMHARWSGRSASEGATDLGLRHHLTGLREVPGVAEAAFIATPDGANPLGVTALVCLAMAEHPDVEKFAATRRRLVKGMLWLQRPSGMFITAFPPAQEIDAQDYYPGEALLALAREYEAAPSEAIWDAFDRAIEFYRGYFRDRRAPAFIPWQAQAYGIMARTTKRQDYVGYVFELTDWLSDRQLTESNCKWAELRGGIAAYQPMNVDISTASYVQAFAEALSLARMVGDEARVARYEKAVRQAARFVMQLQVRPEEAYFIASPRNAVGGVRRTPALNLLRINHSQHALIGLIKAKEVLYAERG